MMNGLNPSQRNLKNSKILHPSRVLKIRIGVKIFLPGNDGVLFILKKCRFIVYKAIYIRLPASHSSQEENSTINLFVWRFSDLTLMRIDFLHSPHPRHACIMENVTNKGRIIRCDYITLSTIISLILHSAFVSTKIIPFLILKLKYIAICLLFLDRE